MTSIEATAAAATLQPLEHHPDDDEEEDEETKSCPDSRNTTDNNSDIPRDNKRVLLLRKIGVLCVFCFISGWADTLAVIHFQTFAAMMTGNIVFFGISIAPEQFQLRAGATQPGWYYIVVILCNVFGAFVAQTILLRHYQRSLRAAAATAAAVTVSSTLHLEQQTTTTTFLQRTRAYVMRKHGYLVATFCLIMMLIGSITYQVATWRFSLLFFAASFGAQNSFTASRLGTATTVMTGNTQKWGTLMAMILVSRDLTDKKKDDDDDDDDNDDDKTASLLSLEKVLPHVMSVIASTSTLVGAIVGGACMHLDGSSVTAIQEFVITGLQLVAFIMHEELL